MSTLTPEAATALRRPFPPESIGKLPKGGQMLDYVGHAAVVDRLLSVDPEWYWEPFAIGPDGLPALDRSGNLWIRLTICGVTRIGVGDGKSAKECIGDALRNAAMRFGVALDLWAKENLVEFAIAANSHRRDERAQQAPPVERPADRPTPPTDAPPLNTRGPLAKRMFATLNDAGITDKDDRLAYIGATIGRTITSSSDMTDADAKRVIDALAALATDEPTVSPA